MKTKSILLTLLPNCFMMLAFMFFASSALAQTPTPTPTTIWRDGTSLWDIPENWTDGAPNSTTAAQINNRGTAQIYTDPYMAYALSLTLGLNAGDSGNLEVKPPFGDLTVVEAIFVGKGGTGRLTITQGNVESASASIASLVGELWVSSGSATVDGEGSHWIMSGEADVGGTTSAAGGTGLLKVTNSGTVIAANVHVWASGTLTGNGTVSTTNGTTVDGTVAPNGGGSTLTVGGPLQLDGGSATQCNVSPQDPSTTPQVSVSGQVSLGGHLLVTMIGDFTSAPTRFTLLYANTFDVNHPTFDKTSITYPTGQGCWNPVITYVYIEGHVYVYLDRVYTCN